MQLALPLILAQAAGQLPCMPPDAARDALSQAYGEHLRLGALTNTGGMVQFFGNSDSGTWSLLVVTPDGTRACFVAVGDAFMFTVPGEPA